MFQLWSVSGVGFKPFFLPHGVSFEFDGVGVVDEAVEDGVGERGFADEFVPVLEGQLGGDESAAATANRAAAASS